MQGKSFPSSVSHDLLRMQARYVNLFYFFILPTHAGMILARRRTARKLKWKKGKSLSTFPESREFHDSLSCSINQYYFVGVSLICFHHINVTHRLEVSLQFNYFIIFPIASLGINAKFYNKKLQPLHKCKENEIGFCGSWVTLA